MAFNRRGPHSLGKSVEWKLVEYPRHDARFMCPHSLGKSVEWKPFGKVLTCLRALQCPHSLGKSVEWKLD